MKKRFCSWFLALAMVLGMLPAAVCAVEKPGGITVMMSVFDRGTAAKDQEGSAVLLRTLMFRIPTKTDSTAWVQSAHWPHWVFLCFSCGCPT